MAFGIILAILTIWAIVCALIVVIAVIGAQLRIWTDEEIDEYENPEDIV